MRVEGIDMAAGAYRVAFESRDRTLRGLVPEALLGGADAARPSHQTAHEALARHSAAIELAIRTLSDGGRPRPPYDVVTLTGES